MDDVRPQPAAGRRGRRPPDAALVLAALAAALAAQYLFTGELLTRNVDSNTWSWRPAFTAGTALLALAIAAAALLRAAPPAGAPARLGPAFGADWAWLVAAGGCYALASAAYLAGGETAVVDAAWVVGVVTLVGPLAWARLRCLGRPGLRAPLGRESWREWAVVGALTAVALALRGWDVEDIPSHVDNDVAFMGVHALALIEHHDYRWIGASSSGHLLSYDQYLAWGMRLFGQDHAGLVMQSVLLGTLTVPVVYLLGREMFGPRVGLVAAGLLAVDYTHVHFSRILFGATTTFLLTLAVLLLYRGLRDGRALWLALSGVVTGFGLLLYDAGRVGPVLAVAAFGWAAFAARGGVRRALAGLGIFLFGALLAFGPVLAFAASNFRAFVGRGNTVALWSPDVWRHEQQNYGTDSAIGVVLQQIGHTFLTFHLYGDSSPHFAFPRPMVAATTAALLVIGVGSALRRFGDLRCFLLLGWIVLTGLLGGVITYDPPYWPHLNVVLPAVAVLAALGAEPIFRAVAVVARRGPSSSPAARQPPGRFPRLATAGLAGAIVLYTGVTNWTTYYTYVRNNAGPRIRIARYVDDLPDDERTVYLVSDELHADEPAFAFYDHDVPMVDLPPAEAPNVARRLDPPATFVVVGHDEVVPALVDALPGARVETHFDADAHKVFVSVSVGRDDDS